MLGNLQFRGYEIYSGFYAGIIPLWGRVIAVMAFFTLKEMREKTI
jgi:hypothetical protein